MRHKLLLLIYITFLCSNLSLAQDSDINAINALTQRLIPQQASQFEFVKTPCNKDNKDCFTISSNGNKIKIAGNNANSMAVGLNRYFRDFCNTTVSWYAEEPVILPSELPIIPTPISSNATVDRRFFLNYCTYGYTMPFFNWNEWERLIDWMALNGINMPLAITGQEMVWYNVWKNLGMKDEEIRSYFTGPTYLPWHRMANIDGWNGPLPMEWLEGQKELQKKILDRERSLNMKPVLPAFAGHVPAQLKDLFPKANIKYLGKWAGFKDEYRCHFLNPEEPLFAEIQKLFLEEQTKLFGTDHIYGVDPFNEVDPPSWDPKYLKEISKNTYQTLTAVDPKAEWMQMTWMFYHDKKDWTAPRIKALLTGVPKGRMSLLDYHCENVELWKSTDKFHGQPYIWCYLGNFGGNTTITGNVKESGERLNFALNQNTSNLKGIGSTLEGLEIVQFPYEYIFDKAWTNNKSDSIWVNELADRHLGIKSESVRKAWQILFNDIYIQVPRTLAILPNLRPILNDNHNKRTSVNYDPEKLTEAWNLLLQAPNAEKTAFQIDLITVGRQVLGNYFLKVKTDFDSAYINNNINALRSNAALMQEILKDLDTLNSFNNRSSISKWIEDARTMGSTSEIKNYYEKNARNLITTWGGSLNDYASRTWAGLINNYYAPRWQMYIDEITTAAENNIKFDQKSFDNKISKFENDWVDSNSPININKGSDLLTFCRLISRKYSL